MKYLEIKQRIVMILLVAFLSAVGLGIISTPAVSAAVYDNQSDCEKNSGLWFEKKCWYSSSNESKCKNAGGKYTVPPSAPLAVTTAGLNGYCAAAGSIGQEACSTGRYDLNGNCITAAFCQKYPNNSDLLTDNERKACQAGYLGGDDACRIFSGKYETICDTGHAEKYCEKYSKGTQRDSCRDGYVNGSSACKDLSGKSKTACNDGAKTSNAESEASGPDPEDDGSTNIGREYKEDDCKVKAEKLTSQNCELIETVVLVTNVLSGLAATVIVAMIVLGGIQYSMAGAEAAKVQAAKQKITNALLALMLLIFGFSIIQWLIPGGLI